MRLKAVLDVSVIAVRADEGVRGVRQPNNARARQAGYDDHDGDPTLALSWL